MLPSLVTTLARLSASVSSIFTPPLSRTEATSAVISVSTVLSVTPIPVAVVTVTTASTAVTTMSAPSVSPVSSKLPEVLVMVTAWLVSLVVTRRETAISSSALSVIVADPELTEDPSDIVNAPPLPSVLPSASARSMTVPSAVLNEPAAMNDRSLSALAVAKPPSVVTAELI